MIISRTPFRTSFFGGGTDYHTWYEEHGGAVLAATINHYCYITCRFLPPFFTHKSRVVWSKVELAAANDDIQHPVVNAALRYLGIDEGVEIHHDGDLPARSGLGSSSAFAVGILNALHALKGERVGKAELARQAIHIERRMLNENVGVQDQIQTCFGGINRIAIRPDGNFQVEPLVLREGRAEELQRHLLMFYTGISRTASDIAGSQMSAARRNHNELAAMHAMVDQAADILCGGGDIGDFGRLLHESWRLKRSLAPEIAPGFVDDIYARARAAGALGGKVLGAGGGGFMLFFARPDDHQSVLTALSELLVVPISFDYFGTQIIFYDQPRFSRTALAGQTFRRYTHDNSGTGGC